MRVTKRLKDLLPAHRHRSTVLRRLETADRGQVLTIADNAQTQLGATMRQLRENATPDALEEGTEALVILVGAFETLARRCRVDASEGAGPS